MIEKLNVIYMFIMFYICFLCFCKAEELGRDPTLDEIFVKTHTKKDSSWVDDRAKKSYVRNIEVLIWFFNLILLYE